ncbi:MAG: dihydrolipoyl dehydrogenase [Acidimicrobiales bacterium]
MITRRVQVAIIGAGPGGYVAGIRCGQLGLDTVVVDDRPLGGTCLNVGCIPSKALIHAADEFARMMAATGPSPLGITAAAPTIDLAATVAWKDGIVERLNRGVGSLLRRAGTEVVAGRATVVDGKTCDVVTIGGDEVRLEVEHLVLATGSAPVELAAFPFGGRILSSTEALSLTEVPPAVAVIGGGYIGLELGTALAKLGSHVTIIEAEDRILPLYDRALSDPVRARLDELDVTVRTATTAVGPTDDGIEVEDASGRRHLLTDKILVTVGRRPALGSGIESLDLTMNRGAVAVDECGRTSMRDVWAIGDLTGEPMLAHRAMRQGEVVAEAIAGKPTAFDPRSIPAIVFTDPEIVAVGADPAAAEAAYGEAVVGTFPLTASARAMTLDRTDGFVRVVARPDDHLVVGIQAVGSAVAELSSSLSLALEMGARLEDLALTIQAHPTVGEALRESALAALGWGLHR